MYKECIKGNFDPEWKVSKKDIFSFNELQQCLGQQLIKPTSETMALTILVFMTTKRKGKLDGEYSNTNMLTVKSRKIHQ